MMYSTTMSNTPEKITQPSPEDLQKLAEAREQIAMKSQKHLERWALQEAPFVVFRGVDLVRGLPWPDGHKAFQHIVMAYRSHRLAEPDDERPTRHHTDPLTRDAIDVSARKTDGLTIDELSSLARFVPVLARRVVDFALTGERETARKTRDQLRLKTIEFAAAALETDLTFVAEAAEALAKTLQVLRRDLVALAIELSD